MFKFLWSHPGMLTLPVSISDAGRDEPWGKAEAFPQATLGKKSEIFFPNEPFSPKCQKRL